MLFAQAFKQHGCATKAMEVASDTSKQNQYYQCLGRFARKDPCVKAIYLQGSSVKSNRVVAPHHLYTEFLFVILQCRLRKHGLIFSATVSSVTISSP